MTRKLPVFLLLSVSAISAYGQQTPLPGESSSQRSVQRVIIDAPFAAGGYLGVQTVEITKENFSKYGLSQVRGVAVEDVTKDSPADRAGLRKGDVIVRLDGEEVTGVLKLRRLLQEIAPDHQAKITILRQGGESEFTVTLAKRPTPEFRDEVFGRPNFPPPGAQDFPRGVPSMPGEVFQLPDDPRLLILRSRTTRQIGINVTNLNEQLAEYFGVTNGKGLLVNRVAKDSPAARAGIEAGDVIVEADGKPIANNLELLLALSEKRDGDVTLTIVRDKNRRTVTVTPEISKDAPAGFGRPGAPFPLN